jgi:hypothetical protein
VFPLALPSSDELCCVTRRERLWTSSATATTHRPLPDPYPETFRRHDPGLVFSTVTLERTPLATPPMTSRIRSGAAVDKPAQSSVREALHIVWRSTSRMRSGFT